MTKAALYIKYALMAAVFFLAVSIFIRPSGFTANDGISYYGVYKTTIVPYALAFLLSAIFYWRAASALPAKPTPYKYLSVSLEIVAVLIVGLLLSPASVLEPLHITIGSILFSFQLLVSIWLIVISQPVWPNINYVLIELFSGIAALYYFPKHLGWLLQAQVIFQLAFGLLVIKVINKVSTNPAAKLEPQTSASPI